MAEKINFGKRIIEAIPTPAEGRARYKDSEHRFLYLDVFPSGKKTFLYVRWTGGKTHFIKIGNYPEITPSQARDKADELSRDLAQDKTPAEIKAESKHSGGDTFATVFNDYLERHLKPETRRWQEDERTFKIYLEPLHRRGIREIMPEDIKGLHKELTKERGEYMANRAIRLVRSTYNFAIDGGLFIPNPAAKLKFNKEPSRDRYLDKTEMTRFFDALNTLDPDWQDFFRLALFTGARRANLQAMKWEDIDLERKIWTIPAAEFKTGEKMQAPLIDEAIQILEKRQGKNKSEFVFHSHGKAGHITEPKGAWKRLLEKAKIKDLRIHDLRRTLGSFQTMTGANTATVGQSLGHKPGSPATAVYARLDLDTVRGAVEKATAAILQAANGGGK